MRTLLFAALLAASPLAVAAEDRLSYTFVEAGWNRLDLDSRLLGNDDGDGGYIRGSLALGERAHVFGSYSTVSDRSVYQRTNYSLELDESELGIGYHQGASERVHFIAELAWVRQEVKASLRSQDIGGYYDSARATGDGGRVAIGVRGTPSDRTELWLKAGYLDGGDFEGDFVGTLGGQFNFNRTWGLVGQVEFNEGYNRLGLGVRASF